MLDLPENADEFVKHVLTESRKLVQLGIWEIQSSQLDGWLKQFDGKTEEFFSACILYKLILRSDRQLISGLQALFRGNLEWKVSLPAGSFDGELVSLLSGASDPGIRLVPVIRETDPPTKSGPLILRMLKRALKLEQRWMCWPWQCAELARKKPNIQTIIFVDDFSGTGVQFTKFYELWKFDELRNDIKFIYAPIMAHKTALNKLSGLTRLEVVTAEILDEDHSLFSPQSWNDLTGGLISSEAAIAWYKDFVKAKDLQLKTDDLGVGELALTLGFGHATPNNSLPSLWTTKSSWFPLLER